jgi:predicted DNA-binding transcriptional regulator AlpA
MTMTDSIIRLPAVLAVFPISRASWYAGIREGRYPASVKLGPRAVGWRRSDIEGLIAACGVSK